MDDTSNAPPLTDAAAVVAATATATATASPPPVHRHQQQHHHPRQHPQAHPLQQQTHQNVLLCWALREMQVFPGSVSSLALRICQFSAAIISFSIMISASNFSSVTAFCFLVAAMVLQCMWSFSVATIEIYALRCGRNLRDSPLLSLFAVGDWITAVVTLAGACASAGIAVLIGRDVHQGCDANYCGKYATAAGMAFLSWLLISTSFLFTFWLLATR